MIHIGDDNQLKDVDKNWVQHTEDYPTKNKYYKAEDKGGYAINIEDFNIERSLVRPRIMEDGNESLQTMRLQDKNSSQDMVSTHDDTKVYTFIIDPLSREDQLLDILNRNKSNLPCEVLTLLKLAEIPSKGGRGEK